MEKKCSICDIEEGQRRLVHALDGKEVVVVCEKCAKDDELIIIKKPTEDQINYANKPYTVRERLVKALGSNRVVAKPVEQKVVSQGMGMPKLYCVSPYHKYDLPLKVVENFHWTILKARKQKKLNQNQVAQAIQEPVEVIKVIESGCLSEESSRVLRKLEQYFGIKLLLEDKSPEVALGKVEINKDSVKTLSVGDLIRIQRERERRAKEAKDNPKTEEVVGDEVELEEK